MKRNRLIIVIVVLLLSLIVRFLVSDTTLFVDTSKTKDGYLPISDYVLLNEDDKEVKKINSFNYDYYFTYYDYDYYKTTLGIDCKSSFEDFVKAYGDYTANYISANRVNNEDDYSDYLSFNWITVNDFYNNYIKTNKINLDEYNIDISFECLTRFNKVYYDKASVDNYYSNNGLINFSNHLFTLRFVYQCKEYEYNSEGINRFDYIQSSQYYS